MADKPFVPSPYQANVFEWVTRALVNRDGRSLLINAVAGSGKTTTIVEALRLLPPRARVTFLAFNRAIARELGERMPQGMKASTFHSAGLYAWRKHRGSDPRVDEKKLYGLMDRHFSPEDVQECGEIVRRLVGLARNSAFGISGEPQDYAALIDHYGLDLEGVNGDAERVIDLARKLLVLSVRAAKDDNWIDFDDMLYMPVLDGARFFQPDWLFVDEAQDTNALQLSMLRRMLRPGGHLVAVGDRNQAIYGFRGASAKAMDEIKHAFNCDELPLSVCYRCGSAIVLMAQQIVPQIEPAPDKPTGEVLQLRDLKPDDARLVYQPTDAILCRNTAPLISEAYSLIASGIGCRVLGRDIGKSLIALINKMKAKDGAELALKLESYYAKMSPKFIAKGQETKAEALRDQIDSVLAVIEHAASALAAGDEEAGREAEDDSVPISIVLGAIERLFSDEAGAGLLTLCTVHKAKGREWPRVFILRRDLMPSRWARSDWQVQQEMNLIYVAYTRAKEALFL